jgi:hypothetical protein
MLILTYAGSNGVLDGQHLADLRRPDIHARRELRFSDQRLLPWVQPVERKVLAGAVP